MVKFSKELRGQLIPEWKEVFVNYWQLKKHIEKIKISSKAQQQQQQLPAQHHDHPPAALSICDPFYFLSFKLFLSCTFTTAADILQVRKKRTSGLDDGDDLEVYQTELLHLFSEEDEVRVFFSRLDEELNKVNQFYKGKEREFVERGEILNKQLQTLRDLNQLLSDRRRNITTTFSSSPSSSASSHRTTSNVSESQSETNDACSLTEEVIVTLERSGVSFVNAATSTRAKIKNGKPKRTMRIDIPATTPARTISAVISMLWEDLVNNPTKDDSADFVNHKKIQCAEKMIRSAFVELYRGLGLLKTYSSLNMIAFTKILKKFDKVSHQQASTNYLKAVKSTHFISSDKVVRLMDEVEIIFTKHFANNDRKKAMKFLRPQQQKDSHMVTFFVGLLTGCFVSLFGVYIILAHLSGIFSSSSEPVYMDTIYPVFSMFALLSLHLFMYGCNLLMWRSTRINYNFIFEFLPSTALKYRDAFLICTTFMTSVVGAMVIHLLLRASEFSSTQVDAIPGILMLIFFALLICPFDIFYRPTRFCFIRVMRNIVCAPFYKVLLVDFFMADQLTSQIPLLRHLESMACYFLAGCFRTHQYETCKNGRLFRELAYVVSFLPYYWRAMQCARRWFDESDVNHLANMGKYVSAMVAAGARITCARQNDHLWLGIVLVTSTMATVYQLYWDFVKDWGLLNRKSRNPWLRDELILRRKSIYFLSMALNVVLRVAWVESILQFRVTSVQSHLLDFSLASLEVIRRGHWNFYRLENEHLNNVGKFRAVKIVPLPFREMDLD